MDTGASKPATGEVPAETPATAAGAKKPLGRKWTPPPPKKIPARLAWTLIIVATGMVVAIAWFSVQLALPVTQSGPPALGPEFEDQNNNWVIRRPANWVIEDPHDGANIYIKGPREKDFSPVIIVNLEIKAGGITSYLEEHKGRIKHQDKSVEFISEESDSIDGCPNTVRLEYDCEMPLDLPRKDATTVKVRTLQYIMEDRPRFYRVTCHVAAEAYERYLPKFEASARSFRRAPLRAAPPRILKPEGP